MLYFRRLPEKKMRLLLDRYALGSGLTPLYHNFPSKPGNVHILYIFIYGLYIFYIYLTTRIYYSIFYFISGYIHLLSPIYNYITLSASIINVRSRKRHLLVIPVNSGKGTKLSPSMPTKVKQQIQTIRYGHFIATNP